MGNGGIGAAVVEPVRGAKTARLEHVRAVLAEAPAAAEPGAVKRRPRPQVLPLPRPVRRDQAARRGVPLLWPPEPAGVVPLSAAPPLGQARICRWTTAPRRAPPWREQLELGSLGR